MRGSIPVFWQQVGSKITESRSLESSNDGFMKHLNRILEDYSSPTFLAVNLMSNSISHEEKLTSNFKKLLDHSAPILA